MSSWIDLVNFGFGVMGFQPLLPDILPGLPKTEKEWVFIEGGSTGLSEADITAVCRRAPEKILALYTDAAILARDIKRLTAQGCRVTSVLPFDPAPQTAAIGAVAEVK